MSDGAGVKTPRGVRAVAEANPQRPAVIFGDQRRTYRELAERAARLATLLAGRGVAPGLPVAAVLPNGIEALEVATAAAMLNAPYLPVNWHLKAAELEYLLADSGARAVVGHADLEAELANAVRGVAGLDHPFLVGGDYEEQLEKSEPLAEADPGPGPELVFYTSGTTARPKGVVHGGLAAPEVRRASMESQVKLWGWTEDDVYVMSGPAYHAAHAGWSMTALYIGATIVILSRFDARTFLGEIERHRGTRSFMVPSHFIRVLELTPEERATYALDSFALVVHGGAPCPVSVKRKMMEAFPQTKIHELYGASEGGATRISPEEWLEHPGSVGLPWPGVEVRILDDEDNPVPPGTDGVIWIRPPGTSHFSYRNDPAATVRAWRDDAFSVGDVGHLDEDGYLTITDRVSDLVLWGGVNIAPKEIEDVLFEHRAVIDCAVFGIPDDRDGEHLKAMVELREPVSVEELATHVRDRLADYKVPHIFEIVDELPRDPNGKVLKRLLRQVHQTG